MNTTVGDGNAGGPPDELYAYRPGGTTTANGSPYDAVFSADHGRTAINDDTDPASFLTDGSDGGLLICDVGSIGDTISFKYGYSEGSIRICKYNDVDMDGIFDAGEELEDWPFRIDGPSGPIDVTTRYDGCVVVGNLPEDTYDVTEMIPTPDSNGNFELNGKRWHAYTDPEQTVFACCGETSEITYRNVCLGSVTAVKFHDENMNGVQDAGEEPISSWPVRLTGTKANGDPVGPHRRTHRSGWHIQIRRSLSGNVCRQRGRQRDRLGEGPDRLRRNAVLRLANELGR